jgi:hypothetical protein
MTTFELRNKITDGVRHKRAHACNPSYSGGRDLEDHRSRPAWAKSLQDIISKNTKPKEGCEVPQVVESCLASMV